MCFVNSSNRAYRSICNQPPLDTYKFAIHSFIHFPFVPNLEHRAPFGVSVIIHTLRHTVGLLWTSDQLVAETSTYIGQHNM
jgi:hypothetical protein